MNMPTNKPSLKEKLYQETLDEFARKQWNPESQKNDFKNWKELTDVYSKKNKGWLIYTADIEKAILLAIEKTEAEAYVDAIKNYPLMKKWEEEVIRADTTEQIFKKLNEMTIKVSHDVVYLDTRKLLELEKEFKMDK